MFLNDWLNGLRRCLDAAISRRKTSRLRRGYFEALAPRDVEILEDRVLLAVVDYSTYLGGDGNETDAGVATDTEGNTYVIGSTGSTSIAGRPVSPGAFVTKFNPDGTIDYLTNIGPASGRTGTDVIQTVGEAIAVSADGVPYAVYVTVESDLDTLFLSYELHLVCLRTDTGAPLFDTVMPIPDPLTAEAPEGHLPAYFLGAGGLTVDNLGSAYVTYEAVRSVKASNGGAGFSDTDYFLTKVKFDDEIELTTPLAVFPRDIAVDNQHNIYIVASTNSKDLTVSENALQSQLRRNDYSPDYSVDMYVAMLDPTAARVLGATYLGGTAIDLAGGIAVDPNQPGIVYIAGGTSSTDFPLKNAIQSQLNRTGDGANQDYDGFISKINLVDMNLMASTYLGGSIDRTNPALGGNSQDVLSDIALDSSGNVYVVGETNSLDFPTVAPLLGTYTPGPQLQNHRPPLLDYVVAKLDSSLSALEFSTYYGGTGQDSAGISPDPFFTWDRTGPGVAVDLSGRIHVAGVSKGNDLDFDTAQLVATDDFPQLNAAQDGFGGGFTTNPFWDGAGRSDLAVFEINQRGILTGNGFTTTQGRQFQNVVAQFVSPRDDASVGDFSAEINWGDGSTSVGTIRRRDPAGNVFLIEGIHQYDDAGAFPITVNLMDKTNDTLSPIDNIDISHLNHSQTGGTIAVNPSNPKQLFAAMSDDVGTATSPELQGGIVIATSSDGGASWSPRVIGPSGNAGLPKAKQHPDAVFDVFGNLILTYEGAEGNTIVIAWSTDGGKTFSPDHVQILTLDGGAGDGTSDVGSPKIAAGGPENDVWVTYGDVDNERILMASAGSGPGVVSPFKVHPIEGSEHGFFSDVSISHDGKVAVTWQRSLSGLANIMVSVDPDGNGSQDFSEPVVIASSVTNGGLDTTAQEAPVPLGAVLAWDNSGGPHDGRLYAAFVDQPHGSGDDAGPALFVAHTDGDAKTWTTPERIEFDLDFKSMILPSIAVDQVNGNLAVGWYGTLAIPETSGEATIFYVATSSDGVDFSKAQPISDVSNALSAELTDEARSVGYGEAPGMAFFNGRLYPAWSDNSKLEGENIFDPEFEVATAVVGIANVQLPPILVFPVPIEAVINKPFDGNVATFTYANDLDLSAYEARIQWGDGSQSTGTITQPDGPGTAFRVEGQHTYTSLGAYPLWVSIHDKVHNRNAFATSNTTSLQGSQTSPSITINPTNFGEVFATGTHVNAEHQVGLPVAGSQDGGATWESGTLADGTDDLPVAAGDADAVFDQFGNLWLTYLTAGPNPEVVLLLSVNGGLDFTLFTTFTDGDHPHHPAVAVGPGSEPGKGSVWVTWERGTYPFNIIMAFSATASGIGSVRGFTQQLVAPISADGAFRDFADITVGPNGQALLTYTKIPANGNLDGPAQLVTQLDPDGVGPLPFGDPVVAANINIGLQLALPAIPEQKVNGAGYLAWDRSGGDFNGRVYLVYADSAAVGSVQTDIFIRYSDDNGQNWTEPIQINDADNSSQFLPNVAVDQSTGFVGVGWYTGVESNSKAKFAATVSDDGGVTWNRVAVLVSPDSSDANASGIDAGGQAFQFGFHSGLSFVQGTLQPIWADNAFKLNALPDPPNFDLANARVAVAQVSNPPLVVTGVNVEGVEGRFQNARVATFVDPNGSGDASKYSISIDWGDGHDPGTGFVVKEADGSFTVYGGHEYEKLGSYHITVKIKGPHVKGQATPLAIISNAPLNLVAEPNVHVVRETEFTKVVAKLYDDNPHSKPTDFIATIEWGDGSVSQSPLVPTIGINGGNGFEISGTHKYLSEMTFAVKVSIAEPESGKFLDTTTQVVSGDPALEVKPGEFLDIQALAGVNTGDLELVTFSTPDDVEVPLQTGLGEYTATINWGDGQVDNNIIPFMTSEEVKVTGRHTYTTAGQYFPRISVQDDSGGVYSVQLIALVEPDVSSQVHAVGSGLILNPVTQKFVGDLNITNTSTTDISGPLYVVIHDLPAGVTLDSFTGIDGQGNPLYKVDQSRLSAGASLPPIPLGFSNPSKVPITYTVQVFDGLHLDVTGGTDLIFEPNRGQANSAVDYLARGQGYSIGLSAGETALMLSGTANQAGAAALMRLVGANESPVSSASDVLPGVSNYLSGTTALTDVPHFARVHYQDVYSGIDVEYYGRDGLLEYDWFVKPGADANAITERFDGVDGMSLDGDGNLRLQINGSQLVQRAPVAYQYVGGVRIDVSSAYELRPDGTVGFTLGDYDHSQLLIIDPVLIYATYFGGTGIDTPSAVAVDDAGNTYITGQTGSSDFFTVNPFDPELNQPDTDPSHLSFDAFVTKLDAQGVPAFSTYLGGGSAGTYPLQRNTDANDIAVDPAGHVWIVGDTQSTLFPTTDGGPAAPPTGFDTHRAFLTELSVDGSTLVYSTVVQDVDSFLHISIDDAGMVYTTTAGVLRKFDPATKTIQYNVPIGDGFARIRGVCVDTSGQVYVTGYTNSSKFLTDSRNFPKKNALFPVFRTKDPDPEDPTGDGFVVKVLADGTVDFATFLGGSDRDGAEDIAVDSTGGIYVVGFTYSDDLPVPGGVQTTRVGDRDGFLIKLANDGSAVLYGTYLGGSSLDHALSVAVDANGRAYITGSTLSPDLPTTDNAYQPTSAGGISSGYGNEGFAAALNPDGSAFDYFTYFGGTSLDNLVDVASDANGNASYVGFTHSPDLLTRNPAQSHLLGFEDGFVVRLLAGDAGTITLHNAPVVAVEGAQFSGTVAFFETTGSETASQFSATIDWGDGLLSPGTITGDFRNGFQVQGTHVYQDAGTHDVFITLLDAHGLQVHVTSTTIATAQATGRAFYHVEVDTTELQGAAGKLSLQFNPGAIGISPDAEAHITGLELTDGTLGTATLVGNASQASSTEFTLKPTTVLNQLLQDVTFGSRIAFDVEYSGPGISQPPGGTFSDVFALQLLGANGTTTLLSADSSGSALRISVAPDGSTQARPAASQVSVAASGLATIANGPINLQISPFTVQEGLTSTLAVATFTDGDPSETAEQFTATIDWGDGTPISIGDITGSDGQFTVSGTHAYHTVGSYALVVTVTEPEGMTVSATTGRSILAAPTFKNGWGNSGNPADSPPVSGDFNGDGILDVAVGGFSPVPTSTDRGVSILLGQGDGSFLSAGFQATGTTAMQLALADFNHDGKLDVAAAIATFGQTTVELLLGNGDGTLQPSIKLNSLINPGSIVAADVNRDGAMDIVYTESLNPSQSTASFSLKVALGNNDGTFDAPISNAIPFGISSLFAADMGNDGIPDLVVASANFSGSTILSYLQGMGDGSFAAPTTIAALGFAGSSLALGDFDGDGKQDLAAVDATNLNIFQGHGDGTFGLPQQIPASNSSSITAGDFDGDGRPDLATGEAPSQNGLGRVRIFINDGSGNFAPGVAYEGVSLPTSLVTADFDRDGHIDLATSGRNSVISVLPGIGDGTFASAVRYGTGFTQFGNGVPPQGVATADVNGDGDLDAVFIMRDGPLVTELGNGAGTFQSTPSGNIGFGPSRTPLLADVNHDGFLDVVTLGITDSNSTGISIVLGKEDGTFPTNDFNNPNGSASPIVLADFNHDGRLDVASVISVFVGNSFVRVSLANADGTWQDPVPYPTGVFNGNGRSITAVDFNGDSQPDLFVTDGAGTLSVLPGNSDGTFSAPLNTIVGTAPFITGIRPQAARVADFDGDGKLDAVAVGFDGTGLFLPGNGDGTFGVSIPFTTNVTSQGMAVGDVNGDGKLDIVTSEDSGELFSPRQFVGGLSVLLGNGDGTFQPKVDYFASSNPNSVTLGDFNQDGRLDIATANFTINFGHAVSGSVSILLGNPDGTFQTAINYTATGLHPVGIATSDLNADGKLDLVVLDQSNDTAILMGNGNGTFQLSLNYATIAGNVAGSEAVAIGDLNQDGRADIISGASLMYGNGDGTFLNQRLFTYLPPVVNTDIHPSNPLDVAAGDLNGDGNIDLAVSIQGTTEVLFGNGTGSFLPPLSLLPAAGITAQASFFNQVNIADMDGDGDLDVVTLDQNEQQGGAKVAVWRNNGSGVFSAPLFRNVPMPEYDLSGAGLDMDIGDLNGDGHIDVVVTDDGDRTQFTSADILPGGVNVLLGVGDGSLADSVHYLLPPHQGPYRVTLADLNHDGRPEIVVLTNPFGFEPDRSAVAVFANNGDGTFGSAQMFDHGLSSAVSLAAGDFNGDGAADIIIPDSASFSSSFSIIYAGKGTALATDAPVTVRATDLNPQVSQPFIAVVATFADANPFSKVIDFTATINWGDGQSSLGTIQINPLGGFEVVGTHNYGQTGVFTTTVTVRETGEGTHIGTATARVSEDDQPLTATGVTINAMENLSFRGIVASFTDADVNGSAADFSAMISWGDSQSSAGLIVPQAGGGFGVLGTHTYATAGNVPVHVDISDIAGSTAAADSAAHVAPHVNQAPVADDDSYATREDIPLVVVVAQGVLPNDSDPEGSPLAAVLVSNAAHGNVTLNADGSFTYTPAHNFNGIDSFTYRASDGSASSNAATVTIMVRAVMDPPTAVDDSQTTNEDTAVVINVLTNDIPETGTLDAGSIVFATLPTHGLIGVNALTGAITYTPFANYAGADSLKYKVADSHGLLSNAATVSITVAAVNDAPLARQDHYVTNEDSPLTVAEAQGVLQNDFDVEGSPLTAAVVTQPLHGSVTLNNDGSLTYTPTANYSGPDSFTYRASDGATNSPPATVSLIVLPVKDAATISGITDQTTNEGTPISIDSTFTDPDQGDTWTATVDYGDGTGEQLLSLNGTGFNLNHNYADSGQYTVTIKVFDQAGMTGSRSFRVNVENLAPSFEAGEDLATIEGTLVQIESTVTDPGVSDTHTATIDWGDGSPPQSASVLVIGGVSSVVGSHSYLDEGTYAVTVTVTDNEGATASDSLTVTVSNAPPRVTAGNNRTTFVGTEVTLPITVTNNGFEAGFGPFTFQTVAGSFVDLGAQDTHTATIDWGDGTVEPVSLHEGLFSPQGIPASKNGSISATHAYTSAGEYTVVITVTDNDGGIGTDSFAVTVNEGPNSPPVASDDTVETPLNSGVTFKVLSNDTDADGALDVTTVTIVTPPSHGTMFVNPATGDVTYSPADNYAGPDSFTYTVKDDFGATSNEATVNIDITSANHAPVMTSLPSASAPENFTTNSVVLDVNATDADQPAQTLSYALSGVDAAAFSIDPQGQIRFLSSPDYENPNDQGRDHVYNLTVTVSDSGQPQRSAAQDLTIAVTPVNDNTPTFGPSPTPILPENSPNGTKVGTVVATDLDQPQQSITYSITAANIDGAFAINPTTGDITVADSHLIDYETNPSFTLTITATDNGPAPLSSSTMVTITLTDVVEGRGPQIAINGPAVTWYKKLPPINVAPNLTLTTGDAPLAGAVLVITLDTIPFKRKPFDQFTYQQLKAISNLQETLSSDKRQLMAELHFDGSETEDQIQAALRDIEFTTRRKGRKTPIRTVHISFTDSNGMTADATQKVNVLRKRPKT